MGGRQARHTRRSYREIGGSFTPSTETIHACEEKGREKGWSEIGAQSHEKEGWRAEVHAEALASQIIDVGHGAAEGPAMSPALRASHAPRLSGITSGRELDDALDEGVIADSRLRGRTGELTLALQIAVRVDLDDEDLPLLGDSEIDAPVVPQA